VADERILRFLTLLTILLFVGSLALPMARGRSPWLGWARWAAVAAFSLAVLYALWLTWLWALQRR
jgi:protein-S-isoprenylcysteine O-methyltransferase Ste14